MHLPLVMDIHRGQRQQNGGENSEGEHGAVTSGTGQTF
jgi:hypothetical protein